MFTSSHQFKVAVTGCQCPCCGELGYAIAGSHRGITQSQASDRRRRCSYYLVSCIPGINFQKKYYRTKLLVRETEHVAPKKARLIVNV